MSHKAASPPQMDGSIVFANLPSRKSTLAPPSEQDWTSASFRSTQVHNANSKSINSAVFAQLTAERPYILEWATPSPSKLPLPIEDGTIGPSESSTQTASRLVQPFLQGSLVWQTDRMTNRQTDHAIQLVIVGWVENSVSMRSHVVVPPHGMHCLWTRMNFRRLPRTPNFSQAFNAYQVAHFLLLLTRGMLLCWIHNMRVRHFSLTLWRWWWRWWLWWQLRWQQWWRWQLQQWRRWQQWWLR